MTYQVVLLPRADRDAQQIHDWIAQHSLDGAAHWFARLAESLASLEAAPERFALAPENDFVDQEIRQVIFKTRKGRRYRALFTIVGTTVRVLHVRAPGQQLLDADEF